MGVKNFVQHGMLRAWKCLDDEEDRACSGERKGKRKRIRKRKKKGWKRKRTREVERKRRKKGEAEGGRLRRGGKGREEEQGMEEGR